MNATILRNQLLAEIQYIPENHLEELHNVLRLFRSNLNTSQQNIAETILSFAGAWEDMDDTIFTDIQQEIITRRQQAFHGRRAIDANTN